VSGRGTVVCSGTVAMVRGVVVPFGHSMATMGTEGVTTLHFQKIGKPKLPPPPARGCNELVNGVLENGMQHLS
jgi:hypothetical protein